MKQTTQFSIIIPTYNRLEFLKQAIGSVMAQTHERYEIIVIDDGSTDGTADYLASLGNHIKVLHQANKGPAAARNIGAEQAVGNYIAFLDSDDVWPPWALSAFNTVIQDYSEPSLITAATVEFQGHVPTISPEKVSAELFTDFFQTASDPAYVGSGALVVKRSAFNWANGFDETLYVGEDLDLYFRLGTARNFVRVQSPVTLAYRRHDGNVSTALPSQYAAAVELLAREVAGSYPGGKARRNERWRLLSRVLRSVAFSCLRNGLTPEAWHLYWQSFPMNARLGRLRFLAGFVLYGLFGLAAGHLKPKLEA